MEQDEHNNAWLKNQERIGEAAEDLARIQRESQAKIDQQIERDQANKRRHAWRHVAAAAACAPSRGAGDCVDIADQVLKAEEERFGPIT